MNHDKRTLERIAEIHGPRVLAYLARRTTSPDDAADVFQAVLIVAWRRLPDISDDEQAAIAWLLGTARRCLANHRRGHTRRLEATERLRHTIHIREPELLAGQSAVVEEALASLGAADRELLTLIYWEDLTTEQAATVLNIAPAAARKRLERARTRLRLALQTNSAPEHVS
ncbi:MAG: sigma-70 family RNA polymerase sigma factor [Solirubrobacteraceae bacterium]